MKTLLYVTLFSFLIQHIASQQITDIWQTTWDRKSLFSSTKSTTAIKFGNGNKGNGSANIVVDDGKKYQSVIGFGGSLTDSAASTLDKLKSAHSDDYWKVLKYMFDPTPGANAAGLSYVRVPIGASDFSATTYSLDDTTGDTSFKRFNINRAPAHLFSVLKDILSVNKGLKVHLLPWSPPAWMKDSNTMNGGSLKSDMSTAYPTYLLKAVQGFQKMNIPVHAISIQNEPENSNPTYPSCKMSAAVQGQIGKDLRKLLDQNNLKDVKIVGFEHNWSDAGKYPVDLMKDATDAFDGVAFHCYEGKVAQQDDFHSKYSKKDIYFTECAGTIGSDWWSDIKWYMDNLWIGALEHNAIIGLMWNIALDDKGQPVLPGTNSCGKGCRALVSINSNGQYTFNQEFYSMAQASKAILPTANGGAFGQRMGVSVGGSNKGSLRVGAYVTPGEKGGDERYSLVVLNWNDNVSGKWNPTNVDATIEFRGQQVSYTFPVGVTTLLWSASAK